MSINTNDSHSESTLVILVDTALPWRYAVASIPEKQMLFH